MKNPKQTSSATESDESLFAHALTYDDLAQQLNTSIEDGLSTQEAKSRFERDGPNELGDQGGVNIAKILLRQIANAMMLVLILAMAVSFGIQSWIEGGVIVGVILINIGFGFSEEYKAEKTMNSLRSLSSPTANVVRDGRILQIATRDVVTGDMVELKTGDTVPADLRLAETVNLSCDEALLTGESVPAEKDASLVHDQSTGPGDRLNVAFSSSTVTKGRGRGIVHATGMNTEIGSIAMALRDSGSHGRQVKRKADGSAGPHRYAQAWVLTLGDVIGSFLGVNVVSALHLVFHSLAARIVKTHPRESRTQLRIPKKMLPSISKGVGHGYGTRQRNTPRAAQAPLGMIELLWP